MSMAIAMTVLDGAILVADGYIQTPLGDKNLAWDDIDKIEQITDSIFAIRFGVEHVAGSAIKALRTRLANNRNCRAKSLFASLEFHLRSEWESFLHHLPAGVDPDHDNLGVGVLCGGLAGGVPFIAGVMHHVVIPNHPILIFDEGPGRIYAFGFDDRNEREQFYQDIEQIRVNVPWKSHEGPCNAYIEHLLARSGAAIREVESQNADTGGVIRYVVVRKEFPVEKSIGKDQKGKLAGSETHVKGAMSAARITTGTMSANRISAGTLNCSLMTVSNLSATSINTGTLDFGAISRSALSIISSEIGSGAVTYGKIGANAVRTNELYIDSDLQFKPGAVYNKILGCDAIYHKDSTTGYDTEPYVALFSNQISISAGTGGSTYIKGPGYLDLVSSGGKVDIKSGGTSDIVLTSADDIILDVADADYPMYIKDWWTTGGAQGTAAGRVKLISNGITRYLRLYTN